LETLVLELAKAKAEIADQKRLLKSSERDAEKYMMLRNLLWRCLRFNQERCMYEVDSSVVLGLTGKEADAWEELVVGTPSS
jgi:hypothetical protein